MPLPTPSDPLVNSVRIRQQTGMPFWQPPIVVLQTDINQVAGGGNSPGWVSGSPANLADGAATACLFDLGPDWDQYERVAVTIRSTVATSLSNITMSWRDDAVASANAARYCRDCINGASASIIFATITTANSGGQLHVNVMGRYFVVVLTNTAGSGAQGSASSVVVAMLPN